MSWWRRNQHDDDLDREIRSHLESEAAEHREAGLSPEEARYAARRAFGNVSRVKESVRDLFGMRWLEQCFQDFKYAIRAFAHAPGFIIVAVLTLALGIGASSAIFSVVDAVLLHPLPYPNADRLVVVWEKVTRDPNGPPVFDSYSDFLSWKAKSRSFERVAPATWARGGQILTGAGPAQNVLAMPAGVDFFRLLGISPEIGRTFQPDDLTHGCTVVLKHTTWMTAFSGQKDVFSRRIELNHRACTIIGVMPKTFTFYPDAISMWMLITPDSEFAHDPENAPVGVFGLLKPGVSLFAAQRELEVLYRNEHRGDPGGIWRTPAVFPLAEQFSYLTGPNLRFSIVVLFAAVSLVLLIACVNIANLLLGRSLARHKELTVRAALGSGRVRLIRQLLTESLLLALAGASFGMLLAAISVHYFRVFSPIAMPPGNPVAINRLVLFFTAALATATSIAFGLFPALKASRVDLMDALRAGRGSTFSRSAGAFTKTLVVAEVTFSLVLLTAAALLIQSVSRLASVPLGFRTDHLLSTDVDLPPWSYATAAKRARFYSQALDSVSVLPGVKAAAFVSSLPLSNGRGRGQALAVEGRPEPTVKTAQRDTAQVSITGGYFQAMDVPLEAGRTFDDRDREASQPVAIVNRVLARKYFPHEDPIGKRIKVGEPGTDRPWLTIVGIAADERDRDFFREMTWVEIPLVFQPLNQDPPSRDSLIVRTATERGDWGAAIQKRIAALDNGVPMGEVQSMDSRLARTLSYPRFRAGMLGTFAALALLLAAVGVYGVLAQSTVQRTQEFGVRTALGAQRRDVLMLVIRQGLLLTGIGMAAGLAVTFYVTRLLSALLYSIQPADVLTFTAVLLLLALVALSATLIPAWRAARVDPIVALRYE
jgi:putative ABC transport system permease protein